MDALNEPDGPPHGSNIAALIGPTHDATRMAETGKSWGGHPGAILVIALGLAIRLLLMPTAGYGDLQAIAYALHLLAFDGVFDIYSALHVIPPDTIPVPGMTQDFFPYPPLTYLVLGGAMGLLRPLYGDEFAAAVTLPHQAFLRSGPALPLWLFLYKLPLFAADLGVLAVFGFLGRNLRERLHLMALWALNPVAIIATYLFGQFDILPALFLLLSWALASRGAGRWGAVALGLSAAFKVYSLLLIPIYAVIAGQTVRERLVLGAVGLLTFGLTLVPLAHDPLLVPVLFGSDAVQRSTNGIVIGHELDTTGVISPAFLLYGFIGLLALRTAAGRPALLLPYLLAVLLAIYGFTFGHLQWLTGAAALLVVDWVRHPANRPVQLVVYGCALFIAASWQVGGFLDFFVPVMQARPTGSTGFWHLLPNPLGSTAVDLARSVLAGAALFWTYDNLVRPVLPARSRQQSGR